MRFTFISAPHWFLAPDFLINVFSFLILLTFFILCVRSYKLNKNKGILYLGIGFAFIAVAQLALLMTKFGLYYDTSVTTAIGNTIIEYHIVKSTDVIYNISIFINGLLTLAGLYVIYRLPQKEKSIKDLLLILYFVLLSAFISNDIYYIFHISALMLFILISYSYYAIYRKNKFSNTLILSISFLILAVSQLLFVISQANVMTVVADVLELVSYIILLALIIKILKHGKKKEPDGYNLRHAKYHPRKRGKD
ncbi:MAG: hypothetical protein KGH55_02805 [Nanoarchaeota archaeon]|nr:hypothetical protein [Nanoarchaeota archaeon]